MSPEPGRHFPYIHSGEPPLPAYQRFRAEGLTLRQSIRHGLDYLRKWRNPKISAPSEEIRYFDQQRRLLHQLSADPSPPDSVRVALFGDLMWLRNSWDTFVHPEVLDHLNARDIVVGNLESPVSKSFAVPSRLPDYLSYNSDPRLVASFRRPDGQSTFTALATCNNHCLDRGDRGLLDTLDFLDSQGIRHAGVRRRLDEPTFATWTKSNIRFGFHAACWGLNDPARLKTTKLQIEVLPGLAPQVRQPVELTRVRRALLDMDWAGIDFKIVYLHWGYEFEYYPCPYHMQIAREIIRAGADLVMGSHPHVVQPMEVCYINGYEPSPLDEAANCILDDSTGLPRKGLIVYSLGNFASVMFTNHCRIGLMLSLDVARNSMGQADWFRPTPCFVYNAPHDGPARTHRLVLLDNYLRRRESSGKQDLKLRHSADFICKHVLCGKAN